MKRYLSQNHHYPQVLPECGDFTFEIWPAVFDLFWQKLVLWGSATSHGCHVTILQGETIAAVHGLRLIRETEFV
jgi:hypothetical protein